MSPDELQRVLKHENDRLQNYNNLNNDEHSWLIMLVLVVCVVAILYYA